MKIRADQASQLRLVEYSRIESITRVDVDCLQWLAQQLTHQNTANQPAMQVVHHAWAIVDHHHQTSAGPQYAGDFVHTALRRVAVMDDPPGPDKLKTVIGERKTLRILSYDLTATLQEIQPALGRHD